VGIITKPYEAYRRILNHGSLLELIPIAFILALYFSLVTLVKIAAFRPFILTQQFIVLALAVFLTYTLTVLLLWAVSLLVHGRGTLKQLAIGWGYTLIPTVSWFFITSVLYVLFPPPRTSRPLGILFSVFYLVFSCVLFFWKITLSYLTLRFGMKLDLFKIAIVTTIVAPVLIFYSIGMYRLGIFKVPFL